jgi:hypothetical protein
MPRAATCAPRSCCAAPATKVEVAEEAAVRAEPPAQEERQGVEVLVVQPAGHRRSWSASDLPGPVDARCDRRRTLGRLGAPRQRERTAEPIGWQFSLGPTLNVHLHSLALDGVYVREPGDGLPGRRRHRGGAAGRASRGTSRSWPCTWGNDGVKSPPSESPPPGSRLRGMSSTCHAHGRDTLEQSTRLGRTARESEA